jgi:Na+-translocating ferredoxin:NAD+ oxidoreductase RNF subunit RnfB
MEQVDFSLVANAVVFMATLGVLLASFLVVANKYLWVYEDPRIHDIEDMLPATNCGACGKAGCHLFAQSLISGEVTPSECTVSSSDAIDDIADYLGVDAGETEQRLAYLACAGGSHVAYMRSHYSGLESCRAAALVAGGPKGCNWGCIGLGDCADVCTFGSITMDAHGLPVVSADSCTACGDCVDICPKNLFSIQPVSHRLWVACANLLANEEADIDCEVACNACERCAMDSPEGLIDIRNNLAVIDYSKNNLASPVAIERCPTGAIVWLDEINKVRKGTKARKIIRTRSLPVRQNNKRQPQFKRTKIG